jgi:hypothetical protein
MTEAEATPEAVNATEAECFDCADAETLIIEEAAFGATAAAAEYLVPPQDPEGGPSDPDYPWKVHHERHWKPPIPTTWVAVYWQTDFDELKDPSGKPYSRAIRNYLFSICAVADLGFVRLPSQAGASLRFHYGSQQTCCSYSRTFRNYANPALCSTYFAVHPNGGDYWFCHLTKPPQGSRPMSQQTLIRTIGHSHCTLGKRWFPEQSPAREDDPFFRSPYMSQALRPEAYGSTGVAISGHDTAEIGRLRQWSKRLNKDCRDSGWLVQTADISG